MSSAAVEISTLMAKLDKWELPPTDQTGQF